MKKKSELAEQLLQSQKNFEILRRQAFSALRAEIERDPMRKGGEQAMFESVQNELLTAISAAIKNEQPNEAQEYAAALELLTRAGERG